MKRRYSDTWSAAADIYGGKGSSPPPAKRAKKDDSSNDDEEEMPDILNLFKGPVNVNCYSVDNKIYFNDEINMTTIGHLNKELRQLQTKLQIQAIKMGVDPAPIKLHITTYGGSIHAALSTIACIKTSKVPVHTIIDGYVASAGTLISVCGAKRYIYKHSNMLIHELRSGLWGKYTDMEEEMDNLKKLMEKIKDIYVEHTKLKRKDLNGILKKDKDWDAGQCLAAGLVDEIIE